MNWAATAARRAFSILQGRPRAVLALGVALEAACMAGLSVAPFAKGTPGAIGLAIAVLAALAAGPLIGAAVALAGWTAFMLFVAGGDALALVALPVWVLVAYAVGVLARALHSAGNQLAVRQREQEELRRLDTLKTQFIALASHELRTPAAAIYGIAATLERQGDALPPESAAQLRHALYDQSERLRTLIDQLLDLSRLEAHAVRIDPQPIPIREQVEDLLRLVTVEGNAHFEVDVPPDLVANVDKTAFERIVGNLVTNACRYGQPPVVVSAEQRDRHFRLTVEDHGPGVPRDLVPTLFERFSRAEGAQRALPGSAGLGLAIARAYAHAHGGDVIYEPAEPHGARFELVLPRTTGG